MSTEKQLAGDIVERLHGTARRALNLRVGLKIIYVHPKDPKFSGSYANVKKLAQKKFDKMSPRLVFVDPIYIREIDEGVSGDDDPYFANFEVAVACARRNKQRKFAL